jgi:hypothetical protein
LPADPFSNLLRGLFIDHLRRVIRSTKVNPKRAARPAWRGTFL